jgi:RND family efflux transporter MFP subunit
MKKFYFAAVTAIFILSASFIGYGIFLNMTSDNYIETMMSRRVVRLRGTRAVYRELNPEIVMTYVTLYSEGIADATAQIEGTIEEIFVSHGQRVRQGDRICRIVNRDITLQLSRAETDITKAEAAYLQSKSVAERDTRLSEKNAISKSELESSTAQMKAARAELDAAGIARDQLRRRQELQTVTAPADGDVITVYQDIGNYVSTGAPIALIGDFAHMAARLFIPEEKIQNLLPVEDSYTFMVDLTEIDEKAFGSSFKRGYDVDTTFDMRLGDISPPLSESAIVRNMVWELDNSVGVLEPGLYTNATIRSKKNKRVLSIPLEALTDRKNSEIYLKGADSRLETRRIKTGVYDNTFIEVAEGLEEGDVVITSGIQGLEPGVKIDVIPD